MAAEDLEATDTADLEPSEDTSEVDASGPADETSLDTGVEDDAGDLDTSESDGLEDDAPESQMYAGKYESIQDLEQGYAEAQQLLGNQSAYVQFGRMAAEDTEAFQQWYRERQTGRPEPEPQVAFQPPVEYTPALQDAITRYTMANGEESGLPPQTVQQVQEYLTYTSGKWNQWYQDPYAFANEIAAPVVMEQVRQQLIEPLKSQMWAASFQHQNPDVMSDPERSGEFMSLVQAGNTPQTALELVRLRQQVRGIGQKEAGVEARERTLENREGNARRHVKRRSSRTVDLSIASLEKKFAHLPGAERGRAVAKAMGAKLTPR